MKPTESADPSPEFGGELPSMRAGRAGRLGVLGPRTSETRPIDTGAGGQERRGVLPFLVVGLAVVVLTVGIVSALSGHHALFPGGPVGWAWPSSPASSSATSSPSAATAGGAAPAPARPSPSAS